MEDILDVAVLGDLNMDDVENEILHELIRPQRRTPIIRSNYCGRLDLDSLTREECKLNFRFYLEDIYILAEALGIPDEIVTHNSYRTTGVEGLSIYLRRLAYPNRLFDLENFFGLSAPYLSVISNTVMTIINENKGHLLKNLANLHWLNENKLRQYAGAIANKGSPIQNCWGFIDGTARPICRPSVNQQEYFSGHKRHHCVKYQSIISPDGIVVSLSGAYPGRRHDAGILRESNIYAQLEECTSFENGNKYVLYGDPAYPVRELLLCPYPRVNLNGQQQHFNTAMSSLRQAVEWGFGKIIAEFAFLDFKKNQKLLLQDIEAMYNTAMILTNSHTCLYGSQTANYFNVVPPTLQEYLEV